ncbi:MAG: hypothetical protein ACT4QD_18360 [Acidobacteriota bacterium]
MVAVRFTNFLRGYRVTIDFARRVVRLKRQLPEQLEDQQLARRWRSSPRTSTLDEPGTFWSLHLSRDGQGVTASLGESEETRDIWLFDVRRGAGGVGRPVTSSGGANPHSGADGRELFFLNSSMLMRAAVTTTPQGLEVGHAEPLFDLTQRLGDVRVGSRVRRVAGQAAVFPWGSATPRARGDRARAQSARGAP